MENNNAEKATELFSYKGYPLVRKGNEIYYGNASDEFVIYIQILGSENIGDLKVANKLKVIRMSTDNTLDLISRITKQVEKTSLYEALEIANIWLSRAAG